jgi:hypothetical protein
LDAGMFGQFTFEADLGLDSSFNKNDGIINFVLDTGMFGLIALKADLGYKNQGSTLDLDASFISDYFVFSLNGSVDDVFTSAPSVTGIIDTFYFGKLDINGVLSDLYSDNPGIEAKVISEYGTFNVNANINNLY